MRAHIVCFCVGLELSNHDRAPTILLADHRSHPPASPTSPLSFITTIPVSSVSYPRGTSLELIYKYFVLA